MTDDIGMYACLRSARDALLPAAARRNGRAHRPATGAPSLARRARNAIIWNKPWRHLVYVVDLCLFWGYRLYLERARRHPHHGPVLLRHARGRRRWSPLGVAPPAGTAHADARPPRLPRYEPRGGVPSQGGVSTRLPADAV